MYQHDLSEKELDKKLHLTSVNAVATVGVDLHTCNLDILEKVPGINLRLAQKVIEARPLLQRRQDLRDISGLGPRTFENCAAFCRIMAGPEPLDATLVHPESYRLANWLLKQLSWTLSEPPPKDLPPRTVWKVKWATIISKGSKKFGVSEERVIAVLENLVDSMSNVDPRLNDDDSIKTVATASAIMHSTHGCTPLLITIGTWRTYQASSCLSGSKHYRHDPEHCGFWCLY
jgi:Helix-hairpin-helix motif/HHH domain